MLTLAPHSLADVYQDIRLLGSLLDANGQAEIIVDQMLAAIDGIRDQSASKLQLDRGSTAKSGVSR